MTNFSEDHKNTSTDLNEIQAHIGAFWCDRLRKDLTKNAKLNPKVNRIQL